MIDLPLAEGTVGKMSDTELDRDEELTQEDESENTSEVRYVDLVAAGRQTGKPAEKPRIQKKSKPDEKKTAGFAQQTWYVLRMLFTGKARKAVHFSVSGEGNRSWILLLPVQILIPAALSVCCAEIFGKAQLGGELILRVSLLWVEALVLLLIIMRLLTLVSHVRMNGGSVCSLVMTAMTPVTVGLLIAAAASAIWAPVGGAVMLLSAMLFGILLYMGFEFACISTKTRSFWWFVGAMMLWLVPVCAMAKQLINFI